MRATFAALRRALRHHRGVVSPPAGAQKIGTSTPARSYARAMERHVRTSRVDELRDVLASAFAGRLVVLAGGPVAGATGRVATLRALGARRCLVLGAGTGTGRAARAAPMRMSCSGICPRRLMSRRRCAPRSGSSPICLRRSSTRSHASIRTVTRSCSRRRSRRCTRSPGVPRTAVAGRSGSRSKTRPPSTNCSPRPRSPTPPFEIVAADRRRAGRRVGAPRRRRGHRVGRRRARRLQRRRRLRALGPLGRRRRCGGSGGAPDAALRARPRRPIRRGHPVQHPRFRHRRRRRRVPPRRTDDPAQRARPSVALRGRLHVLGPARSRPGRPCGTRPAGSARCCASGSDFRGAFTIDGILSADGLGRDRVQPPLRRRAALHACRAPGPAVGSAAPRRDRGRRRRGAAPRSSKTSSSARGRAPVRRDVDTDGGDLDREPSLRAVRRRTRLRAPRAPTRPRTRRSRSVPDPWAASFGASSSPTRTPTGPSTAPRAVAALAFASEHCGAELPALHAASAVR